MYLCTFFFIVLVVLGCLFFVLVGFFLVFVITTFGVTCKSLF